MLIDNDINSSGNPALDKTKRPIFFCFGKSSGGLRFLQTKIPVYAEESLPHCTGKLSNGWLWPVLINRISLSTWHYRKSYRSFNYPDQQTNLSFSLIISLTSLSDRLKQEEVACSVMCPSCYIALIRQLLLDFQLNGGQWLRTKSSFESFPGRLQYNWKAKLRTTKFVTTIVHYLNSKTWIGVVIEAWFFYLIM